MALLGTLQVDIEADTRGLKQAEQTVKASTTRINNSLQKTDQTVINTGKTFGGLGRKAGQAGIQIQQFAGQIQGGQGAMLALSQQAADLGFVLGAPLVGAITGIAASIIGFLVPSLFSANKEMEELDENTADLIKNTRALTAEQQKSLFDKLSKDIHSQLINIGELSARLGSLRREQKEMRDDPSVFDKMFGGAEDVDQEITAVTLALAKAEQQLAETQSARDALSKGGTESAEENKKAIEAQQQAIDKVVASLEAQVGALGLTGTALGAYQADIIGATGAERDRIISAYETIEVYKQQQIAIRENAKAQKEANDFLMQLEADAAKERERWEKDEEARLLRMQANREQANRMALAGAGDLAGNMNELMKRSGKEATAIGKALFLAQKAIQVAQIIAATEASAALAATAAAPAGPLAWFATAAGIRATGYASAGLVAGMSVGEAFAQGGIVGGSSTVGDNVIARVNSGEMILNKAQQGQLFAMANGGGGSGAPNINIVNNGSPIDVEGVSMNRDEITLMINDATQKSENRINNSLSSGRGSTAQSLQKGFRAERRL
jgi:hypothetical protein